VDRCRDNVSDGCSRIDAYGHLQLYVGRWMNDLVILGKEKPK